MAAASYYSSLPVATHNQYTAYNPHNSFNAQPTGDIADYSRTSTPLKPLALVNHSQGRFSGHYEPIDLELEKVQRQDEVTIPIHPSQPNANVDTNRNSKNAYGLYVSYPA